MKYKLWFSLFRVVKCTFSKSNWKNIKHSLRNQIFQEYINSITTGIILPIQLQILFLKFYSKDWLFLKISTKLHIESLQFPDLMLLRKFDACFDPPNFWRFLSEYFIPERFFWVSKTYFLISPRYLYILLISKSNKNFCSQKWVFFWADFLRYEIILPKVLQIKIFRFLRRLNYVNLNLVQITASGHKAAKRYWERNFASHSHCFPIFFLECSEL